MNRWSSDEPLTPYGKDSISGADYFLRGFAHSPARHPHLRADPLLVNFVLFAGAFYALLLQLDGLFGWLHQQIPSWLDWLDYLLWPIALITILVVFSFLFSSVANWIAAPSTACWRRRWNRPSPARPSAIPACWTSS